MPGKPTLRDLPSVDRLLADERLAGEPHDLAVAAARAVLGRARDEIRAGGDPGPLVDAVLDELARSRRPRLRRVLNATGVLVHTNLGRAPLAREALERVVEVGGGYSTLEYDLERGERGSRQAHLAPLLRAAADAGRLSGELHEGTWRDAGTAERVAELEALVAGTKRSI